MNDLDYKPVPPRRTVKMTVRVVNKGKGRPIPMDTLEEVKTKFYYMALQDSTGRITKIKHDTNYNRLLESSIEEAKKINGSWSIFDIKSRFIDGNFIPND